MVGDFLFQSINVCNLLNPMSRKSDIDRFHRGEHFGSNFRQTQEVSTIHILHQQCLAPHTKYQVFSSFNPDLLLVFITDCLLFLMYPRYSVCLSS